MKILIVGKAVAYEATKVVECNILEFKREYTKMLETYREDRVKVYFTTQLTKEVIECLVAT